MILQPSRSNSHVTNRTCRSQCVWCYAYLNVLYEEVTLCFHQLCNILQELSLH
jgi:hypothetical protein